MKNKIKLISKILIEDIVDAIKLRPLHEDCTFHHDFLIGGQFFYIKIKYSLEAFFGAKSNNWNEPDDDDEYKYTLDSVELTDIFNENGMSRDNLKEQINIELLKYISYEF